MASTTLTQDAHADAAREDVPHHHVAVIGAGFGGVGTAIRLGQAGVEDVVVLERREGLGGTWWDNTYPGCACDVPAHLYSFSFAPNPNWSHSFAPQAEILAYLERVAREHGVTDRIRLGTEVLAMRWEDDQQRWRLETSTGPLTAAVVVAACGPLSEPAVPAIDGLSAFEGTMFHSAHWDHGHDLTGERVGVIGTGASAAQFIPHVQRRAERLVVFQRTAGWVMPRPGREHTRLSRALFRRLPASQRALRTAIYYGLETLVVGLAYDQRMLRLLEAAGSLHLRRSVPDPELRARLTPNHRLGCKRIIFSDDYLPSLAQPNVALVTDRIREVVPDGIVTADGRRHALDTIILGTGFRIFGWPFAERTTGRHGRTLGDVWRDGGPQAYLGTVVAGFPNLFLLVGPNTGSGNNSVINVIEGQLVHVVQAVEAMRDRGLGALEVRPEVQDAFNAELQERMRGTVWTNGGCHSWYLTPEGVNRTLWPSFADSYKRRLARFDLRDYAAVPARAAAPA